MRLIVPTLDCNEEVTPDTIAKVIPLIKEKKDPFAILGACRI